LSDLSPVFGVLGGTFDPVHLGHIHVAEHVRSILGLSRVDLMLSAVPPHKKDTAIGPQADRLSMLRLAVEGRPGLRVSTVELERTGTSYTIDTLRFLRSGPEPVQPLFIIGMDSLLELHTWKDYRQLVNEFDLVLVDRPGVDECQVGPELAELILQCRKGRSLPDLGRGGRIIRLEVPPVDISSSLVRLRACSGGELDALVPPTVARYIQQHSLYNE
jgi:nicotinate-nucleotide adenylyltransferase